MVLATVAINLFTDGRLLAAVKFGHFQPNFPEPNNYPSPSPHHLFPFSIQLAINPLGWRLQPKARPQPLPTNQLWPTIIRNASAGFMRPITPSRTYQKAPCEKNGPFLRPQRADRWPRAHPSRLMTSLWFIDPGHSQSALNLKIGQFLSVCAWLT